MINLEKYNITGNIYLGLSGGQDSVVLLHQLANSNYKTKITAVYINHNLSPNANAWQSFCEKLCEQLNIKFKSYSVNLESTDTNIENNARNARRSIWRDLLNPNDVVLLAHHLEDNVETVLYRLFRGSGPTGLSGIKAYANLGAGRIIRPLLHVSKKSINDYALENNLTWITDESNANNKFDRNFIRNEVLPLIKNRWPEVTDNIMRAANLCYDYAAEFDLITSDYFNEIKFSKDKYLVLNLSKLKALAGFYRNQVIRYWFRQLNFNYPDKLKLDLIFTTVINAKQDKNPELKLEDCAVRRYRDNLYLLSLSQAENMPMQYESFEYDLTQIAELNASHGLSISLADLNIPKDQYQDYRIIIGSKGEKAKKYFQELGVEPWERGRMVYLAENTSNKIEIFLCQYRDSDVKFN